MTLSRRQQVGALHRRLHCLGYLQFLMKQQPLRHDWLTLAEARVTETLQSCHDRRQVRSRAPMTATRVEFRAHQKRRQGFRCAARALHTRVQRTMQLAKVSTRVANPTTDGFEQLLR